MDPNIAELALASVRSEPRIGPHFRPEALTVDADGVLTIEGEVESVAQKRLALERLAAVRGVSGIVDRLHVRPALRMSDDGIMDHLRKAFGDEPSFRGERISERKGENLVLIHDAPGEPIGEIEIEVQDGIVTLNGTLLSLTAKRFAGVLAWWVPGVRDVINGIAVEPPEEDAPILIEEAVRLALEKDPLIDASQIRVGARHRTVRLTGIVHSDRIRQAAEADAWYVFGVDDVENEVSVGP
jgi:osmotically-inducible protein OsmY